MKNSHSVYDVNQMRTNLPGVNFIKALTPVLLYCQKRTNNCFGVLNTTFLETNIEQNVINLSILLVILAFVSTILAF